MPTVFVVIYTEIFQTRIYGVFKSKGRAELAIDSQIRWWEQHRDLHKNELHIPRTWDVIESNLEES